MVIQWQAQKTAKGQTEIVGTALSNLERLGSGGLVISEIKTKLQGLRFYICQLSPLTTLIQRAEFAFKSGGA
jgi:hypothetical protein